jgi:hypothetical protein
MIVHAMRAVLTRRRGAIAALAGVAIAAPVALLPAGPALAGRHPDTDPDKVAIVVQPSTTQAGTAMAPAVVVHVVEHLGGAADPDYNGPVTLSYAVNPVGAPEPGNNVVTASRGVATFTRLTFGTVGFGFRLAASIPVATSAPSAAFNIVGQIVRCQPGVSCRSGTVTAHGTSASSVTAPGSAPGFLTATAGGFPRLSCTTTGGVLTFYTNRAQTITIQRKSPDPAAGNGGERGHPPGVCWGAAKPFTTRGGGTSTFNPANGDYEGLLPACSEGDSRDRDRGHAPPCVLQQDTYRGPGLLARVLAPPGDPHITF